MQQSLRVKSRPLSSTPMRSPPGEFELGEIRETSETAEAGSAQPDRRARPIDPYALPPPWSRSPCGKRRTEEGRRRGTRRGRGLIGTPLTSGRASEVFFLITGEEDESLGARHGTENRRSARSLSVLRAFGNRPFRSENVPVTM